VGEVKNDRLAQHLLERHTCSAALRAAHLMVLQQIHSIGFRLSGVQSVACGGIFLRAPGLLKNKYTFALVLLHLSVSSTAIGNERRV